MLVTLNLVFVSFVQGIEREMVEIFVKLVLVIVLLFRWVFMYRVRVGVSGEG